MAWMGIKAPFPWFGGKSRVAPEVWAAFGNVANYVEPFFGSGAVLLGAPWPANRIETVNDKDGFVCNFYRAIVTAPDDVARHATWPVIENDLHARHSWLVQRREKLSARLEGDPDYFDTKIAGWWVWGISAWIGREWCSGKGPWTSVEVSPGDTQLVKTDADARGINRQIAHTGCAGQGINRQIIDMAGGRGVNSNRAARLEGYFRMLKARLSSVRICCGDWSRICGHSPTVNNGLTGVFLDPPYGSDAGRDENLYAYEDLKISYDARRWCAENGQNSLLRIAICGHDGEHNTLEGEGWRKLAWHFHGVGYNSGKGGKADDNKTRERIWFSPHCLDNKPKQLSLLS